MVVVILLAAALWAQQAPPPPASAPAQRGRPSSAPPKAAVAIEDLGSVEGQVVSSVDNAPLRKATLTLRLSGGIGGTGGPEREQPFTTSTDAGGRFVIDQVPPGRYDLHVERNGYVTQDLGPRRAGGPGRMLTVGKGERLSAVQVKLLPQAVVTGRVLDDDGEPMAHVQIMLNRWIYMQGKKQLAPVAGAGNTDDRGEYRIYGIAPGRYIVSAVARGNGGRFEGPPMNRADGPSRDRRPDETYPPVYFPAANDPAQASALDVAAGANLPGVDFRLRKVPTVRVRGRITRTSGSRRPAMVMLTAREQSTVGMINAPRGMAGEDGTFEIRAVVPGSYILHVEDWDRDQRTTANMPLEVGRTHVDGVQVRLVHGSEIKGSLSYLDTPEKPTGTPSIALSGIYFQNGANGRVSDDGTFALKNVAQGKYTVTVYNLPKGFYLKSVVLGNQEVLETGFEMAEGSPGELKVIASPHGAQVEGSVTKDQRPANGSNVILWPTKSTRQALFRTTTTDQNGRFTLQGIPPGDYRLIAIDQVEPGAWQDPDFLKAYESKAEKLSLQEKARETKTLVEVPATL